MSKTVAVTSPHSKFWAYDLSLGIWLKFLLDETTRRGWDQSGQPFADDVRSWRIAAALGADHGLELAVGWSDDKRAQFFDLARTVQSTLTELDTLQPEQLRSWRVLDDLPIARTEIVHEPLDVRPTLDLGDALVALVGGTLPPAPEGTWWAIGFDVDRHTIGMTGRRA